MALLEDILSCWDEPLDGRIDAEADFRAVYHDPVTINGAPMMVAELVDRARALQTALAGRRTEVVHRIERDGVIVVGFRLRGRHVGPFPSPLGPVAATGRDIVARVTDILTIVDGRVSDVWVVADDLGVLTQLGAVALAPEPVPAR